MIVDVHTHLPTHMSEVPPDQIKTEQTMRSGETVRLTNSIDDYLKDMEVVDKTFLFVLLFCFWREDHRRPSASVIPIE